MASLTPGNFICVGRWFRADGATISPPGAAPLSTTGVVLTGITGARWTGATAKGWFELEYLATANTLTAATFIGKADNSTSGGSNTLTTDILMMEFSGVNQLQAALANTGTASIPTVNLTFTASSVIVSGFSSDPASGSDISPGTGFTMAATVTNATVGQLQYGTFPAGTTAASFSGSAQGIWATAGIAVSLASSTAAAIAWASQPILIGF